jgi:type I restriction enzyme, S subunit
MAIEQLITENIDLWTSAIKKKSATGRGSSKKIELYGIKKLRELILELAVRGKLVSQDPTDEPASELLKRIEAEKAQLIKDKKIKKPKKLPEILENEKPFELPKGWYYERLGNIGLIFNGNSVNARIKEEKYSSVSEGLPFIATKDVGYGFEELEYSNGIMIPVGEPKFKVAHKGAVLVCAEGGSAGKKCGIANQNICFGNKLFANELFGNIEPRFVLSSYLTPTFYNQFSASMTGIIGGISSAKFSELVIALPPLKEQQSIVAKVDELMALCDQLESQTESSLEAHEALIKALLATLTDSKNAEELNQNWQRVSEHFDTLFTTEQSVDQLKQTILQLAVIGKLVPQNPNDEPASVLLEKIAEEKALLIKDKKIKKQKPLPPISDEENPFELPTGWEWGRIWDVAKIITSGSRDWAKYYSDSGAIFVTMGNLSRGDYRLRLETLRYVSPPKGGEGSRTKLEKHDLLISITGDVGNLGLIPKGFGEAYINQHTCLLRFMDDCQNRFFPELMRSPLAKHQFDAPQRGIKNSFRLGDVGEMVIPIPPLSEQLRIALKVEQLMTLCAQLKTNINDAQATQLNLTDAIVNSTMN